MRESCAHRVDARIKIGMLAVYSVSIFFIDTWWGMAAYAMMFVIASIASKVAFAKLLKIAVPVYVIAAFTMFFNAFVYVDGTVAFSVEGFVRGCFFAARILLLVWASLILCLTASSEDLMRAFASLLSPLGRFHVPTQDIAMVFSVALRFIPLVVGEFFAIRDAQWSRGAPFGEGSLTSRVKAYCVIFVPLFVSMFRRADTLALAMDARCYGMPGCVPTKLRLSPISIESTLLGSGVLIACASVAYLL